MIPATAFAYLKALEDAMTPKLTDRQRQVLNALTDEFDYPGRIASRAQIYTCSPGETASKYCIQLTKLGLAEKNGKKMYPKWRRATLCR